MKRRKMFLAALLIILIVCQSVLPFTMVSAATSYDVEITSNSQLFYALVKELTAKNIDAYYDYANFRIITSQAEIDKVTELDLSNAEIDDLTGLSSFSNVTKLNLTSNELTQDSNLAELDKLPLTSVNLSSNEIESVDSITTFDSIEYTDVTNQQIVKRDIIQLDVSEKSSNIKKVEIELPNILLEDGGEMQAKWLDDESDGMARVNWAKFNPRATTCELIVATGTAETYVPYKGLLKITAKIEDSSSKLYNTNVTLYYVIIDSTETGICFDDDNFYKAVKEQLTAGQYENSELASYGENEEPVTLYKHAYDEAKILVIDTNVVINDIPSLKLNDKKIEDLRGLEKFIGLESTLDLSYNYIDSLERILELEENKEASEGLLLANYKEALATLKENRSALKTTEEEIEKLTKDIDEVYKQINELDSTKENYTEQLNSLLDKLNNKETGLVVLKAKASKNLDLYRRLISEGLAEIYSIYEQEYRITTILPMQVYNMSREDLTMLNYDDSKAYANAIMDKVSMLEKDDALTANEKELLISVFNIPLTMEVEQSDENGNITIEEVDIEYPISEYFEEIKAFEAYNTITDYKQFIKSFKYIDVVTTVMNYCLIERMNDSTLEACVFEEGLEDLYNYYLEQGMDTSYVMSVQVWLTLIPEVEDDTTTDEGTTDEGTTDEGTTDEGTTDEGTTDEGTTDEGTTEVVEETVDEDMLDYLDTIVDAETVVTAYRNLNCEGLYEIDYELEKQLAGHFTNATDEELAKFIVLPRIKYLHLTDNKFESLAGIEDLDHLLGLYAYKNLLGDINDVNWSELKSLYYLDLGYNQLSDISELEVLENLITLGLSRNLLSGNFDFYLAGMGNLQVADFSYNQYSNIAYLVSQYTFIAKNQDYDNVGDFLANSPSAPIISFQYQTLSIKTTLLKESDITTLQLPKIFEQCEELDHLRTSFGETSLNGTVVADGTEVYLRTPAEGDYKACVVIDGHNGNYYTEDGIGFGTSCVIEYTVIDEANIVIPEIPDDGTEPETPENPDDGTEPETPENPDDGTEPETPENPDDGTEPETPENPDDGTEPETPVTPEEPTVDIEYGYNVVDTMAFVNTPEITVKTFKENLVAEGYTVTVLNENREVVTDATMLRTGYVVSIDKDGENLENLEVIVKGDVNGDGEVDALDTGIVRQVINDSRELVGVYAMAADVNSDGEIDSRDSLQILKYRAAKINVFED